MNSHRRTAAAVGVLFLIVNATFLLGALSIESILGAADFQDALSNERGRLVLGVLFEVLNGIAYIGIAMLMFPLLRSQSVGMALGYVIFRGVEFSMQLVADLNVLALLALDGTTGATASSLQAAADLLLAGREAAFLMVSITFGLGALLFYILTYQSRLLPRFLSIWGMLGAGIVLVNVGTDLFGMSTGNLGVVMLLNELFLGVWLIVRGFSRPAEVAAAG